MPTRLTLLKIIALAIGFISSFDLYTTLDQGFFYLQSDEVVHENDLPLIQQNCEAFIDNSSVEGFLFKYFHFWGDYQHYQNSHVWYRKEIRIIRNDPDIHSWESAQSFRRIPAFDGLDYRQQENTFKLKVVELDAHIYHYGWVRPPELMASKIKTFTINHHGRKKVAKMIQNNNFDNFYDYGPMKRVPVFKGTHPAAMEEWIAKFNWHDKLRPSGRLSKCRPVSKHNRLKYRIVSFIEKYFFFGMRLGEFKNYVRIK
ncbi:hypothetical protein ACFLTU_11035 [Bacteroidota bacterium]